MVLKNNPMLASFLVWDEKELESDIALHVTIKHDRKLLDKVIEDAGSLKTLEELEALTLKYPYPRHATFPGPLFRALIYYVEESESYAVLYNGTYLRSSRLTIREPLSYSRVLASRLLENFLIKESRDHRRVFQPFSENCLIIRKSLNYQENSSLLT